MDTNLLVLTLCFFLIAMVYSSVGFGGGSSYLALLSQPVFMLMPDQIRPAALFCNIVVVAGGSIIFYRAGKIVWKEVWPFLLVGVPFSFLGGFMKLEDQTFYIILAVTLIISSFFLWIQPDRSHRGDHYNKTSVNLAIGAAIGFISGLVSIGGGIFLSPFLHFIKWSDAKKISALASLFILVNSVSGLAGQFGAGTPAITPAFIVPLLLAVFLGGQIGSRIGAKAFNPLHIKRTTAVLILAAGLNILIDHS